MLPSEDAAKACIDNFAARYSSSRVRMEKGRGGKVVEADSPLKMAAEAAMTNIIAGLVQPEDMPEGAAGLKEAMALSLWGATQDVIKPFSEPLDLAAVRFGIRGTREIVMCNCVDLFGYMEKAKGLDSAKLTPIRSALWLQHMSKETLVDYCKTLPMVHATLGPGDLLYQPAGWVTVERTKPDSDVYGLCLRGFFSQDSRALHTLTRIAEQWSKVENSKKEQDASSKMAELARPPRAAARNPAAAAS